MRRAQQLVRLQDQPLGLHGQRAGLRLDLDLTLRQFSQRVAQGPQAPLDGVRLLVYSSTMGR